MCLSVGNLRFILLEILSNSWIFIPIYFLKFGEFRIISSSKFSALFFLSSLSGTPIFICLIVFHKSFRLSPFFLILLFFCFSDLLISSDLSSSLWIFSFSCSSLLLSPSSDFLIQLLYFSVAEIYLVLFYSFFVLIFLFCSCIFVDSFSNPCVFSFISCSIFKTVLLNSLSSNSEICVSLGPVSGDLLSFFHLSQYPCFCFCVCLVIFCWGLSIWLNNLFIDWLCTREDLY